MMLKWAPPTAEPGKQLEDWTKGKTYSYALYDNISPTGDSEEGVASTNIAQLWGKTLPALLMAKTEKEFDDKWNEFLQKRKAAGQDKVDEYRQTHFLENKSKLGM
jgi:putative aldouronate transport system substrate-binding protein